MLSYSNGRAIEENFAGGFFAGKIEAEAVAFHECVLTESVDDFLVDFTSPKGFKEYKLDAHHVDQVVGSDYHDVFSPS